MKVSIQSRFGRALYEALPEVYRTRDGQKQEERGGGEGHLAAYLDSCGKLLDAIYNSLEQRYNDCFPETCQEWLLPYFAKLVGASTLSPHVEGRRKEIMHAVAWRQGKGSRPTVAQIAKEIGEFEELVMQEGWKRVARTARVDNPFMSTDLVELPVVVDLRDKTPKKFIGHNNTAMHFVDVRQPNWRQGHVHPRSILLYVSPYPGFFADEEVVKFGWKSTATNMSPNNIKVNDWFEEGEKGTKPISPSERIGIEYDEASGTWHFFKKPGVTEAIHITGMCLKEVGRYHFTELNLDNELSFPAGTYLTLEKLAAHTITLHTGSKLIAKDCLLHTLNVSECYHVQLEYCTVLGELFAEYLEASDCIFMEGLYCDESKIQPPQGGVRYSRYAQETTSEGGALRLFSKNLTEIETKSAVRTAVALPEIIIPPDFPLKSVAGEVKSLASTGSDMDNSLVWTMGTDSDSETCAEKAFVEYFGKDRLMVGAMAGDLFFQQNPKLLDVRYIYLAEAVFAGPEVPSQCMEEDEIWWGCWQDFQMPPGQYLRDFLDKAEREQLVPMITYYTFERTSDMESQVSPANDAAFLTRYFNDWRFMLQQIGQRKAIVHMEPDLWGYAQHCSPQSPDNIPAAVHAANPVDCENFENSFSGFSKCLISMARKYAPNAKVGLHASAWATGIDVNINSNPNLNVEDHARQLGNYLNALGAAETDFLVLEALDRDADYYLHVDPRRENRWWDETNQTLPNFPQHFQWAKELRNVVKKPLVWWQLPVGHENSPNIPVANLNQQNPQQGYRDNRADYFLTHVDEIASMGGVLLAFGAGAGDQTNPMTDGGNLARLIADYKQSAAGFEFCGATHDSESTDTDPDNNLETEPKPIESDPPPTNMDWIDPYDNPWTQITYTTEDLERLEDRSVFFVHNSVGENILNGLKQLVRERTLPVVSNSQPADKGISEFYMALNGMGLNGQPFEKLAAFESLMNGGGNQAQIAFMKFCFADFDSMENDSEANRLFDAYVSTLSALEAEYPDVSFVHVTAPLSPFDASYHNSRQHAFNEKLRTQYRGLVFDLAAIEAVDASGASVLSRDGISPALADDWALAPSGEGGHLSTMGGIHVASGLISFLARVPLQTTLSIHSPCPMEFEDDRSGQELNPKFLSGIAGNSTDRPEFYTMEWGKPGCGVIHPVSPESICHGAEDSGEMGAFHHRAYVLAWEAVARKLIDYLPVGMSVALIPDETLRNND